MPTRWPVVFLLSVALPFGCRAATLKDFDYFSLVMQWPVTFCRIWNIKCDWDKLPSFWTIHGLWPSKWKYMKKEDLTCDGEEFHLNKIPFETYIKMKEQWEKRWPSLNRSISNANFWKHEWDKHGKCAIGAPGVGNLVEYFTKTLELANNFNILEILEKHEIRQGRRVNTRKIKNAFEDHVLKVFPKVTKLRNEDWLFEIHVCFNMSFEVIRCKDQVDKELFYPSYLRRPGARRAKTCPK